MIESSRTHTMLGLAGGTLVALIAARCHELYLSDDDVQRPGIVTERRDCAVDADCVLMPAMITCCGECEPAPPFDAASRAALELLRRDTNASCARLTRPCDPPSCSPLPTDCTARAVCRDSICRVEANPRCF